MPKRADLEGKKFDRLTVLSWGLFPGQKSNKWKCECSCDSRKVLYLTSWQLTSGNTGSCGCKSRELTGIRSRTHGESRNGRTREYKAWKSMRSRCDSPSQLKNSVYGRNGIKVCKRWERFENFLEDMGRCPSGCNSVDRLNPKKNYCKSNCRWASPIQQGENRCDVIKVRYRGVTKPVTRWARDLGLNPQTVYDRYKRGDRGEHLFRQPQPKGKKLSV